MKKTEKKKKYSSFVKTEFTIGEMIYDKKAKTTGFVGIEDGEIKSGPQMEWQGETIYPFPPETKLLTNNVVLFPSYPEEYGDEKQLLKEIGDYIHKYLEVSEFFEKISPFYVLLSWIYDSFKELPYLRAIGDYGCGKSRFLKVIGSVCYKPSFTGGATNPAPIFRIIDQFKGTLVIDEADMRFSDTNCEIVKILNNGFQTGMSVLRCANSENNHEVESYDVFGPKIVATREKYQDKALESRFIVEEMDGKLTRQDIPINLDDNFDVEALKIRNKCLMWRLRNYGKKTIDTSLQDRSVEARLNQVITPLISVIDDFETKKELMDFVRQYHRELIVERRLSFEAPILQIIIGLVKESSKESQEIYLQAIAERYNFGLVKGEKELCARNIGKIIRSKFGLEVIHTRQGNALSLASYQDKKTRLCTKYGLECELVNEVNIMGEGGTGKDDFVKEMENLGLVDPKVPNF